jgi:RNA-directed DNA polymerase
VDYEWVEYAYRCTRKDGATGVDGQSAEDYAENLQSNLRRLIDRLKSGSYRAPPVRRHYIPKAAGGERGLGIPSFEDKVAQRAVLMLLEPIYEQDFVEGSYGFRPGRSAHDAVRQAQGFVRSGKRWVVDIDLKSFFDQVDHDRLMGLVARKVRDKRLLRLIGDYLRAPMRRPDGSQEKRKRGTPQGGPLSPLLANIYLDALDKELEKRAVAFVRYADDIAIFASSQRSAARIYESVVRWIEKHLKVEVNREKSGSGPSDESSLLGFRLQGDGRIGVAPKAIEQLKSQVRAQWDARQNWSSQERRDQWAAYIRGWWNYFELADWRREVEDLSGWIRRHMRKYFWQRWKTPRGRLNALRSLGVKGRALGNAWCATGAWAMAKHVVLNHSLNNRTLNTYGYIIPWNFVAAVR